MVATEVLQSIDHADLLEEELRWCSVTLNEVLQRGSRLEASVFDVEGKHAIEVLKRCKWPTVAIADNSDIVNAFYPGRYKRVYCDKSFPQAIGFLGSAEMLDVQPKPVKFMSPQHNDTSNFHVKKEWILVSRSGTIGNVTFVSETLEKYLVSEHAIRLIVDSCSGYTYAFLRTKIGKALIDASIYGAVVNQIEPEHLESVLIPDPPHVLKKQIHDLVVRSYALRDESNVLLDQAEALLYEALKLPPLEQLKPHYFGKNTGLRNYAVKLSDLSGRLDGSYHVPIVDAILKQLEDEAEELVQIGDTHISKCIILPGRFKRVYVQEGAGTVFFGGKQIFESDPSNKKYLSLTKHADRVKKELKLTENMILITRSGTIGKVALAPKHWENWVINEHVIRVEPASNDIAGFLYVFLASDYGHELITHFTYGAVIDEIDNHQVSQIPIPLLKDVEKQDKINRLALEANVKRTEAYNLEQDAIRITDEEVIHATK